MVDAFDWAKLELMRGAGYVLIWTDDEQVRLTASSYWRLREEYVGVGR